MKICLERNSFACWDRKYLDDYIMFEKALKPRRYRATSWMLLSIRSTCMNMQSPSFTNSNQIRRNQHCTTNRFSFMRTSRCHQMEVHASIDYIQSLKSVGFIISILLFKLRSSQRFSLFHSNGASFANELWMCWKLVAYVLVAMTRQHRVSLVALCVYDEIK